MGGSEAKHKVRVPKISLKSPAPLINLIFSRRKIFLMWLGRSVGRGAKPPPPPPPPQEGPEKAGHGERDEQGEITGRGRPRSPKTVQSAEGGEGKDKRKTIIVVVRSPCQEHYPADAHPSTHKSVLESANPRMDLEGASGCTWSTARATARLQDSRPPE